jgi:hypothetical protein
MQFFFFRKEAKALPAALMTGGLDRVWHQNAVSLYQWLHIVG